MERSSKHAATALLRETIQNHAGKGAWITCLRPLTSPYPKFLPSALLSAWLAVHERRSAANKARGMHVKAGIALALMVLIIGGATQWVVTASPEPSTTRTRAETPQRG